LFGLWPSRIEKGRQSRPTTGGPDPEHGEQQRDSDLWGEFQQAAVARITREIFIAFKEDAAGHEHRGKGKGGGQFVSKGKGNGGTAKQSKVAASKPTKPTRPTHEEAHKQISAVKANPTPEGVRHVADLLGKMTVKEINDVKRSLGIRAGGNKSALMAKLTHEATRRVTEKEHWTRQARAAGIKPPTLIHTAARQMTQHANEAVRDIQGAVKRARKLYAHYTEGKLLTRSMRAFRDGDYSQIPHWDVITEGVVGDYPGLLGPTSGWEDAYSGETGNEQKLFDLVAAGMPKLRKVADHYSDALDYLRGTKGHLPREEEEDAVPFAEGNSRMGINPARLWAIIEALLDAGSQEQREALAEMASEQEDEPDEDQGPVREESRKRVEAFLRARARDEDGEINAIKDTFARFSESFPRSTSAESLVAGFKAARKHQADLTAGEFMKGFPLK
jgi:hypothetical protein